MTVLEIVFSKAVIIDVATNEYNFALKPVLDINLRVIAVLLLCSTENMIVVRATNHNIGL